MYDSWGAVASKTFKIQRMNHAGKITEKERL